mmetsp:Transcript_13569/g.27644  ORF Transcript_13569/g.27644 Transcript_13569/m.27644 type:complete len:180 (+) Transcript_13569:1488-2027(+)
MHQLHQGHQGATAIHPPLLGAIISNQRSPVSSPFVRIRDPSFLIMSGVGVCRRLLAPAFLLIGCSGGLVTSTSEAAFTSFHQKAALFPTGKSKFKPIVSAINSDSVDMTCRRRSQHILIRRFYLFATPPDTPDKNDIEVVTLGEDDTVSDKVWEEVEASAPSELTVMKEVGNSLLVNLK